MNRNNLNGQNSNSGMNQQMPQTNPYYNSNNNANLMGGKNSRKGGQKMGSQGVGNSQSMMSNNLNMMAGQNPYIQQNPQQSTGLSTTELLTGLLVGAAATYVLTNENVQKTLFKGALSVTDILSGGLDEMKERFEDAKAEHEATKEA